VTLTLREAVHHPLRNSRGEEWVRAAAALRERGVDVVVVRDTAQASEPLVGAATSASASLSIEHRAELYASAALNVGINNGPMWMAVLMDVPVLMLRPTTNSARGGYDDKFYARCGVPRGSQLPTSPSYQRLVWEEDYCDNIVRAVEEALCVV
jgi:ADP-heptose:LPS heptosyltransferase